MPRVFTPAPVDPAVVAVAFMMAPQLVKVTEGRLLLAFVCNPRPRRLVGLRPLGLLPPSLLRKRPEILLQRPRGLDPFGLDMGALPPVFPDQSGLLPLSFR